MFNLRSSLVLGLLAVATPALADTSKLPAAKADVAASFATAMSDSTGVMFHKLVEFAPASTRIYSADRELLLRLATTWLQSGQQTMIEIHGYSESLDLGLAERRAALVRRYLIKSGVAPERVTTVGHTLEPAGRRIDLSISRCAPGQCAAPSSGTAHRDEVAPTRIALRPPTDIADVTLTVPIVLDRISTVYKPNLQRCYQMGQRKNPALTGKIQVSFTVTPRGTLENIKASGVSAEVDRCVSSAMTAWRFGIPRDKDGDPTDQSLRLVLAAK